MIPQHLSGSVEHFTPAFLVEAARIVLGSIDFDPASCDEAQKVVRAEHWIGLPQDGLAASWLTKKGGVFLNPPGGKADPSWGRIYGSRSSAVVWWRKLAEEHLVSNVEQAIFVGFNLDILQAAQDEQEQWPCPLCFPFCVPRKRLHFTGDSPTHGNVISYLGGDTERFVKVFSEIGGCVVPS